MKNHLPLVASTLYCQPWAILPEVHSELGALYRKYLAGDLAGREPRERVHRALELPSARADAVRLGSGVAYAYDEDMGLAVVWLEGVVGKRVPEMMSGPAVMDLAKVDLALKELRALDRVENVVLYFDSPGGCSIGLEETVELIRELADEKRVVAYTDYQCCSAAYWLACAADEIYAAPSSVIGSIGCYIAALDSSRAFELEGLELKLFRRGELKALGCPGKQWTAEEEKFLADMAEECGREFEAWVTSRRTGIQPSTMQGQWFQAKGAPAGLLDGTFRDLDELIAAVLE